jgi:hypothetical protein
VCVCVCSVDFDLCLCIIVLHVMFAGIYSTVGEDDMEDPLLSDQSNNNRSNSRSTSDAEQRLRNRSKGGSFSQALAEGLTGPNLEGGVECDTTQSKGGRKTGGKGGGFTYDEIPWGEIFSNPVSLTLFLNMFSYGWIGYMVLTELPSYLTDVLGGYHTTVVQ